MAVSSDAEQDRLEAVLALNILNTPPEERFDRITRLAARFFGAPIALVVLVDEQRQWFKSRYGLALPETPRIFAFCHHTIEARQTLVVEDARLDSQFSHNPYVLGPPHIRFYAGEPLFSADGHALGTLCIIDHQPRHLSAEQLASLRDFALLAEEALGKTAVAHSALTHKTALLETEAKLEATFEQAAVGIAHVGPDGTWLRVNRRLCEIIGYSAEHLQRLTYESVVYPEDLAENLRLAEQLVGGARPHYSLEQRYIHQSGYPIWVNVTVALVRSASGEPDYFIAVMEDIQAKKAAQAALEAANEQLEHRVEQRTRALREQHSALVQAAERRQVAEAILRANEMRIRTIIDGSLDAFVAIDAQGQVTDWNRAAESIFGWSRQEAMGHSLTALLIPERHHRAHHNGLQRFLQTGDGPVVNRRVELPARNKAGAEILVEMTISAYQIDGHYGFAAFLHDISARRAAAEALALSEQRLRTITDNVPVLIAYIDNQLRYRFANHQYAEWFGLEPADMIGQRIEDLFGPEFFEPRRAYIERCLAGESVRFEVELNTHRHHPRSVESTYIPHIDGDSVLGFYALSADITLLKQQQRQLQLLARIDPLTGLPNRRSYEEKLREALARSRRTHQPLALMFLDVDRFKHINDTYGHAGGDELLREFARRLKTAVRQTDTVSRLAGDEFTVVLEGVKERQDMLAVAQKIWAAMQVPFVIGAASETITTSIGAIYAQAPDMEVEELESRADQALYRAKAEGRNCVRAELADG